MIDKLNGLTEEQRALLEKKLRQKKMQKLQNTENGIEHDPANSRSYPISYNQESIWLVNRLYEGNTIYNIGGTAHIHGALNTDAFEEAFRLLIRRHDILRTVFHPQKDSAVAEVLPSVDFHVKRVDLSGQREQLSAYIRTERDTPFDPEHTPAYRVSVIRLGEAEWMILLIIHHLLSDGTSTQIIFRELIQNYEVLARGGSVRELPAAVTYGDFSVWQNRQRNGSLRPDYWEKRLEHTAYQLDFFSQCTKLKQMEDKGVRINFEIDRQMLQRLSEFAKEKKVTLFSILLGGFYLTLYKYSGQKDLFSGVLTSGRENAALGGLIGCFTSAVPFRMELDREQTVTQYLEAVYRQFLTDMQHKDELMTYENENIEYQILFSYETDPDNDLQVEGLSMRFDEVEARYCRSEAELELNKYHDTIRGWLNYREHLFDRAYMEQFVQHYLAVLSAMAEEPGCTLRALEMVRGEERTMITEGFNPKPSFYERDQTITGIFAQTVQTCAGQTALLMGGETVTYAQLEQRAKQIAASLAANGVRQGNRVALISGRHFDLVAAIFGILMTGAAYVPIDIDVPQNRMEFIIRDSGSGFLLTDREDRCVLPAEMQVKTVLMCDCNADPAQFDLTGRVSPEMVAYIIYTSGTTGIPKGVIVNHRNVLRTVRNINYMGSGGNDRLIALASYAFDASVFDIFYSLLNGLSLVLVSKELVLDIPKLIDEIEQKDVTAMFITTALFNALIDVKPQGLRKMRRILFGGERASAVHVRKAIDVLGDGVVVNMYGPTESTVYATFCDIEDSMFGLESLPIGKPTSNTTVFICNQDGNINPVGVPGELIIGGEGISEGYLNRPELTQEKFIEDQEHRRYYRTGDIGKWNADGNIIYCGRVDDQVKYRGFRIELGEIENAILSYPAVERTFVVFEKNEKLGDYLCAYLVTKDNCSVDTLKKMLRKQLPPYMIPNYYVELDELPLNQNGKVDKNSLPKPEFHISKEYQAPVTEMELVLAEIWSEVLGIEKVGVTDHFFELGGHSIKVAKMCALVQERADRTIPLRVVFQHPTIRELCQYLSSTSEQEDAGRIEKIADADRYETSQTQKRMMFSYEMNKDSVSYNIPFAVRIKGNLDQDAVQNALNTLIAQHEILRTRFVIEQGEVYQIVEPELIYELSLTETELSVDDYFDNFIQPFDLRKLPLFRMQLVKTADGAVYLMGDFHHAIFDGVSMQVFLEELSDLYRGSNPEKPFLQYRDFAYWQNRYLASEAIRKQGEYWLERFRTLPEPAELPLDYQRPAVKTGKGEIVYFTIDEELTGKLRSAARRHSTTLNVILMSVYHIFLKHFTGKEDIVTGTSVAGRGQESVQRMLGVFLNTLAFRSYPSDGKTVGGYIEEVKADFVEALDHQDYPFERLVENLNIPRAANRNPLFDTMFIMQNSVEWEFDFGDLRFELCDLNYKASKFDMQLEVYEGERTLKCLIAYADDLFTRDTVELFIEAFRHIADLICEQEDCRIGDLVIADAAEQDLLSAFAGDFLE